MTNFLPLMEVAMGVLGWREREFWETTYLGYTTAYVGWCRANRVPPFDKEGSKRTGSWRPGEVSAMQDMIQEVKRLVPDGRVPPDVAARLKRARRDQGKRTGRRDGQDRRRHL